MKKQKMPIRIINSIAPVRICDNGVMTDTWFAKHGKVFNIAVSPYAEVQIKVFPIQNQEHKVVIFAENYDDEYARQIGLLKWDRHPLLEAALESMPIPENVAIHINIFSEAPSGGSIGSSAAVTVALLGALDCLTPGRLSQHEIAYLAHSIETKKLHQECGIQDQLCSAFGGVNYIEMFNYPHATVSQLKVSRTVLQELERRLILVYLGKSHNSSEMHKSIIQQLEREGDNAKSLEVLRNTAELSRDAICNEDFRGLGDAMLKCTDAQQSLHPEIICSDAKRVFEICKDHGAIGWKVNGAGGEGGSISILCDSSSQAKRTLIREIEQENRLFKNIPIRLCPYGLQTWII